jgi:predicted metal-dependent hydrolase
VPRVEVEGRTIEVAVRRSRRARTTRIVVDDERNVEVVLPLRAPARLVGQVLDEHRAWLARQLARPAPRFCLGLARPDAVWLHGYAYAIPEARSLELWYRERARSSSRPSRARRSG